MSGCGCTAQYTTSFSYDGLDNKLVDTDALGHTTTNTYDPAGNLQTVKNQLNKVWSYDYDAADNKIRETTPLTPTAQVTEWTYDARGLLSQVKSPENEPTSYTYDDAGRRTTMVEPRGNVSGCSCAAQYTWTYELDGNGNVTKVTSPDPDGAGAKTASVTQTSYDELNRKSTLTDPRGKLTSYAYNEASNLLQSRIQSCTAVERLRAAGPASTKRRTRKDHNLRLRPKRQPDFRDNRARLRYQLRLRRTEPAHLDGDPARQRGGM